MPVINRLDMMLAYRKMTLTELANKMGISVQNMSVLKNNAKAIRFSTLAKLCRILDCKPGDLFDYEPDESDDKPLDWVTDDR